MKNIILNIKEKISLKQKNKSYEIDMCSGSVFSKLIKFTIPLMLSGMLQLCFNAADIIVVGQFVGKNALAAVGATGSLTNLIVNLFIGLSVGTNVLAAKYYGAQNQKDLSETVNTSMLTSFIFGIILVFIGVTFASPLLSMMGTPSDVLDQAVTYIQIVFLSMPAMMVYNFGAAVLRAVGDTKRPLYFLSVAGVINVILNLVLVIAFHMGVAGVAIATSVSQYVSAALITFCLVKTDASYRFDIKNIRIHKDKFLGMCKIGLPAGLQGTIFSISNVLIQSSINSFGSVAMAGSTAASNIENFIYTAMNSFYQSSLSFTSQNMGGKKYSRLNRIHWTCIATVACVGGIMGGCAVIFANPLLHIYTSDPQIIEYGVIRLVIIAGTYLLCGMMDTTVGSLRGMGYSVMPMIVSLLGACGFRILWIFTVFAFDHTLFTLYISYPISWFITVSVHTVCYLAVRRKLPKGDMPL